MSEQKVLKSLYETIKLLKEIVETQNRRIIELERKVSIIDRRTDQYYE